MVHAGSAMEAFQPVGTQIATTLVATGMAATTCWQRGGGRVVGTLGGAVDAQRVGGGDVSELQITARVGWKLFGARPDGLRVVQK